MAASGWVGGGGVGGGGGRDRSGAALAGTWGVGRQGAGCVGASVLLAWEEELLGRGCGWWRGGGRGGAGGARSVPVGGRLGRNLGRAAQWRGWGRVGNEAVGFTPALLWIPAYHGSARLTRPAPDVRGARHLCDALRHQILKIHSGLFQADSTNTARPISCKACWKPSENI